VKPHSHFYPVILAGGRGTRFWPLSRKRRAKQLLALDGKETMIQKTVARLRPLASANRFWVITNHDLRAAILRQLPKLAPKQVVAEPVGRNTAPAIGLAAFLIVREDPDAVIGMFPSDHVIAEPERFRTLLSKGIEIASASDVIVAIGIHPTRPETGYGYIEVGDESDNSSGSDGFARNGSARYRSGGVSSLRVRRFTEKPVAELARQFLSAGNYLWNSGMFLWRADTIVNALREYLPQTASLLAKIAGAYGTRNFAEVFKKLYTKCYNVSVDYAVLEPRSAEGEGASHIYCLPANFGWNDLGSWAALHEHHVAKKHPTDRSLMNAAGSFALNAENNFVHAPGKFVATVGVRNLVVVETEDALLITTLDQSQDVGKVVKHLDEKKMDKLV